MWLLLLSHFSRVQLCAVEANRSNIVISPRSHYCCSCLPKAVFQWLVPANDSIKLANAWYWQWLCLRWDYYLLSLAKPQTCQYHPSEDITAFLQENQNCYNDTAALCINSTLAFHFFLLITRTYARTQARAQEAGNEHDLSSMLIFFCNLSPCLRFVLYAFFFSHCIVSSKGDQ